MARIQTHIVEGRKIHPGQHIHLTYFAAEVVAKEASAFGDYLSLDLTIAVNASKFIGDDTLAAAVALDPGKREELARLWRRQAIGLAMSREPIFRDGFNLLSQEIAAAAMAGTMTLAEVECAASNRLAEHHESTAAALRLRKDKLREVIRDLHDDPSTCRGNGQPDAMVIDSDGVMKFFRNHSAANSYAKARSYTHRCLLVRLTWAGRIYDNVPESSPDDATSPSFCGDESAPIAARVKPSADEEAEAGADAAEDLQPSLPAVSTNTEQPAGLARIVAGKKD